MSNTPPITYQATAATCQAATATYDLIQKPIENLSESIASLSTNIKAQAKQISNVATSLANFKIKPVTVNAACAGADKPKEKPETGSPRFSVDLANIRGSIQKGADFEVEFNELKSALAQASPTQLKMIQEQLLKNAPSLGISSEEFTKIATKVAEGGVETDDVIDVASVIAKMAKVSEISAEDATAIVLKRLHRAGDSPQDISKFADYTSYVGSSMYRTDSASVAQFMADENSAIKKSGIDGMQGAILSGALLSSLDSKVQASSANQSLLGLTAASDQQKTALTALGFDPATIANDMKVNAAGTSQKILQALKEQAPDKQKTLNTQLFGSGAGAISTLLGNLDFFKQNAARVNSSSDASGSLDKSFDNKTDNYKFKKQELSETFGNFSKAIGYELVDSLSLVMDKLNGFAGSLTEFAVESPKLATMSVGGAFAIKSFLTKKARNKLLRKLLGDSLADKLTIKSLFANIKGKLGLQSELPSSATNGSQPKGIKARLSSGLRKLWPQGAVARFGERFKSLSTAARGFLNTPVFKGVESSFVNGLSRVKNINFKEFIPKPAQLKGVMRGAGKLVRPLGAALSAFSLGSLIQDGTSEQIGGTLGDMVGGLGGASAGAAIGTLLLPGIGTVLGGMIGGITGGGAGEWIGEKVGSLFGDDKPKLSEPSDVLPPSDSVAQQVAQKAEDNRKTEINISIPSSSGNREQDEDMMDRLIEKMKQLLAGDGMASDNLNVRMDNSLNDRSGL